MCKKPVRIGFARADITPIESVPLRGYGNTSRRMSGPVLSPLYATCMAFSDGENTVLLYTMDMTGMGNVCDKELRPAVSAATGIPVERIHLSCSHNHSAPDLDNTGIPSIPRYTKVLEAKLVLAAVEAIQDLSFTRIFAGSIETEGLNFVRRYVREDGTYCGDNYGSGSTSPIACHESEADRVLQLVYFIREGKKNVILANFQGHPHRLGGGVNPTITSDIVGIFRDELERRTGCLVAYATGGSGNQNSHSRIPDEMAAKRVADHGKILADYAVSTFRFMKEVSAEGVAATTLELEMPVNHSLDHMVEQAKEIQKLWAETSDNKLCAEKGLPYGINSPYHAGAIIRKASLPATFNFSIHALKVGGIGIAVAPYEMFDTSGMQIKEGSPFDMTVIATCANSGQGYVPSKLGWEHGGYSCDTTRFCPGSGEELAQHYVDMLTQLHG